LNWVLGAVRERELNLEAAIRRRRSELADRQFFIAD